MTVPSVSVEWPRDILASVAAAARGETPEPIRSPTDSAADDETETGYDLRDLVRGMGADDVHVGPPRHAGSVVAALDEMATREARAAAVAVEIKTTEEAVRRDESFQRAELERREHARAVLMGSGEEAVAVDGVDWVEAETAVWGEGGAMLTTRWTSRFSSGPGAYTRALAPTTEPGPRRRP